MHAGLLRDRVALLAATTTSDGQGGHTTTWPTLGYAEARAQVRALSGREALQFGALQSTGTTRITLRYRPDLTVQHRLRREPDGPTYELTAVRDVDGRRRWLECDAVEVS
jgi:SPP1 family predicted phage head-tail adaptor